MVSSVHTELILNCTELYWTDTDHDTHDNNRSLGNSCHDMARRPACLPRWSRHGRLGRGSATRKGVVSSFIWKKLNWLLTLKPLLATCGESNLRIILTCGNCRPSFAIMHRSLLTCSFLLYSILICSFLICSFLTCDLLICCFLICSLLFRSFLFRSFLICSSLICNILICSRPAALWSTAFCSAAFWSAAF